MNILLLTAHFLSDSLIHFFSTYWLYLVNLDLSFVAILMEVVFFLVAVPEVTLTFWTVRTMSLL